MDMWTIRRLLVLLIISCSLWCMISCKKRAEHKLLKDGIDQAAHIIKSECDQARKLVAKKSVDSASNRVNAFLSSTHHIKSLSACSLAQQSSIEQCRKSNTHMSMKDFWDQLRNRGMCGNLGLFRNSDSREVSCPGEECPYSIPTCDQHDVKYRTIDGTCNNPESPLTGSAGRAYQRYQEPDYFDGIGSPRSTARGLPSTRKISNKIYQSDVLPESNILTVLHMTYGQLLDHDTDRTPVSKLLDEETGELVNVECGEDGCSQNGAENRNCFPIWIPSEEELFSQKECLKFIRSEEVPVDDCTPSPRQQANVITSWLDASFVYDSSYNASINLRTLQDGQLKSVPHPFNNNFKPLLPSKIDGACRNTTSEVHCFITGDARQNEQVGLQAIHTVFMRYHNYIADNLKERHSTWNDERLYQETRRILGAVWQNTVYNEYLPPVLGLKFMSYYKLNTARKFHSSGYTKDLGRVNPDTANVFATAAFRFGHSQVGDTLRFADPSLQHKEDVFFSEVFFNPNRIFRSGIQNDAISGVNAVMIGQSDQPADAVDTKFSTQIAGHMFTDFPPKGMGTDLPALNTQRGRDHGIPSYVRWIEWCNEDFDGLRFWQYKMPVPRNFNDLLHRMSMAKVQKLQDIYDSVEDVDLYTGAMLEYHVSGGIVGPTFACILAKQFHSYKYGDRYYFENDIGDMKFSDDQLDNIRQQTIASIFCKTLEDSQTDPDLKLRFQRYVLLQPKQDAREAMEQNPEVSMIERWAKLALYRGNSNERVPCSSHPKLNFDLF